MPGVRRPEAVPRVSRYGDLSELTGVLAGPGVGEVCALWAGGLSLARVWARRCAAGEVLWSEGQAGLGAPEAAWRARCGSAVSYTWLQLSG